MERGFSLVEALLGVSVFGLIVTGLIGGLIYGTQSTAMAGQRARAVITAEEGLEALRNIRDENFANLGDGTYGFSVTVNQWALSGSSDTTDIFTRNVAISAIDSRRKLVTANVTWQQNLQRSGLISLSTRMSNWTRNFGNWASPSQESSLNLAGNSNANGLALYHNSNATYAIVVRATSGDPELHVINVSSPASPIQTGSVNLTGNILGVAVAGNLAVAVSDSDSAEIQVVDLSSPTSPTLVGTLNLTGNENALTVAAFSTTAFVGRANAAGAELYAISIATPSSPGILGSLEMGNAVRKITLAQNNQYLYVGTAVATAEFRVISVANPASMSIVGSYNPSGTDPGTAVASFSTYALFGENSGNVSVLDVANPAAPTLVGGPIDVGAAIDDITPGVGDSYAFVGSSTGGGQMQIIDISILASPVVLGAFGPGGGITGVVWDYDLNRAFVTNTFDTWEVAAVKPN